MKTVITAKEFNTDQEKYFDLAVNEQIYIERGDNIFIVTKAKAPKRKYKAPDDDLRKAITMDEVRERLHAHVHKLFAK